MFGGEGESKSDTEEKFYVTFQQSNKRMGKKRWGVMGVDSEVQ